jgi:hypothetical protein
VELLPVANPPEHQLTDKKFAPLNYVDLNYAVSVELLQEFIMQTGPEQVQEIISKLQTLNCIQVNQAAITPTKHGRDSLGDYRRKQLGSMAQNDRDKLEKISQEVNDVGEYLRYTVAKYQLGADTPRRITEAFEEIHGRLTKILVELRNLLPHFNYYIPRLERSFIELKSGDELFIARHPNSYYHVYWQLHTDLGNFFLQH